MSALFRGCQLAADKRLPPLALQTEPVPPVDHFPLMAHSLPESIRHTSGMVSSPPTIDQFTSPAFANFNPGERRNTAQAVPKEGLTGMDAVARGQYDQAKLFADAYELKATAVGTYLDARLRFRETYAQRHAVWTSHWAKAVHSPSQCGQVWCRLLQGKEVQLLLRIGREQTLWSWTNLNKGRADAAKSAVSIEDVGGREFRL